MLADTNINTNNTNDRGTHLTQSPWNPVRFTAREEPKRRVLRQLLPSGRGRRRQGDRAHDQVLAAALVEQVHPRRPRTSDQPERARLDQLLRPLLPVKADRAAQTHRRIPRSMGHAEIQTTATPSATGTAIPGDRRTTRTNAVRPLAGARRHRLDDKSPVSREAHAGICESRGVKLPPATQPEVSLKLNRPDSTEFPTASWRCNSAGRAGARAKPILPRRGRSRSDLGELSSGSLRSLTAALPTAVGGLGPCAFAGALTVESEQADGRCCLAWRSNALGQCPVVRGRASASPRLLNRRADAAVSPSRRRRCC